MVPSGVAAAGRPPSVGGLARIVATKGGRGAVTLLRWARMSAADVLRQFFTRDEMIASAVCAGPVVWGLSPELPGTGLGALTYAIRHVAQLGRPVGGSGNGARELDLQVHLVVPKNFNDAQQIADRYKDDVPVNLNLQQSDPDLSKRLIDFSSGLTYALDGGMQRIADKVFLLTPRNVDVSAEERARLIEKGFFNQS